MTTTDSAPGDTTPAELAALVRPLLDRGLIGFDVDGVLAPIVEHADEAALTPGVHDALAELGANTEVVILSGRSLASLERLFGFPTGLHVIGSHGLEERDAGPLALDERERSTFERLEILGRRAVDATGPGAWLEYKPASVVVHTRSADPERAAPAVETLTRLAGSIEGAQVKLGHSVVELLARRASKGRALLDLAARLARSPIVYLGDDVTDEEAFAMMGDADISVRVGDGATAANHRLAGPDDAAAFLTLLTCP